MPSTTRAVLSRGLAQAVVDQIGPDIPYGLNLIGPDGRILGSVDPARIGDLHDAALEVLRTGEPVAVHAQGGGQRPGLNLPIDLDGERIGVVGVTGPPEDVRPIARLVASTVQLLLVQLIEQRGQLHVAEERRLARERLAERLLRSRGAPEEALLAEARDLGVELAADHVVLLLREGRLPTAPWPAGALELQPHLPAVLVRADRAEAALATIQRLVPAASVVIGPAGQSVRDAAVRACEAARVAAGLAWPAPVLRHAEVAGLCPLTRGPETGAHPVDALTGELRHTLQVAIRNSLDPRASARELQVHRNTLTYRLERIRTLTGRDPRNTLESVELIAGLVHRAPWSAAQSFVEP